jgi:type IV fimbrial biogenesis protein FimT
MYAERMKRDRAGGFTVIELMVVLTIAAIFLALGVPSLADFIRRTRLSSAMNELSADMYMARSEAIKRNTRVLLCARSTTASTICATAPAANTWMNGWLVCTDADSNGVCDATSAANPNPIKIHAALVSPLALTGPAATIVLLPLGNALAAATFTMTGNTSVTRTATIALSGTVSVY